MSRARRIKARQRAGLPPEPRKTRFTDLPGGGVCWCLNPEGPVCADCTDPEARLVAAGRTLEGT